MAFDLETALRTWRQRANRHPGLEPGMAEELEAHLRDALDEALETGEAPEAAFQQALARGFDDLDALARDYHRAAATSRRPASWDRSAGRGALLASSLRTAYRKLARRRGYAAMNVAGLALALACGFLVLLFVVDELGYDRFHPDAENLYRVAAAVAGPDGVTTTSRTPGALAPLLEEEVPAIAASLRFLDLGRQLIRYEDEGLYVDGTMYVDSSFFEIFGFPLLRGDARTVLRKPNATVITETTARRFFGDADPIGRVLTLGVMGGEWDFVVEGLVADAPRRSHIQFDLLLPFTFWEKLPPPQHSVFQNWVMNWQNNRVITYVGLQAGTEAETLEAAIPPLLNRHVAPDEAERVQYQLEALPDIYLRSSLQNELGGPEGDIRYVYLFATLGLLILLIAAINFINLTTAHAGERARETGIRKVLGARRGSLVGQYLGESLVVALLAALAAAVLAVLLLPSFGDLVGKPFTRSLGGAWGWWLLLPMMALLVGTAAGLYPALLLSSFQPMEVLKSTGGTRTGQSGWLRRVLVVSQFAAATVLLVGTFVVRDQLALFQEQQLGFTKEQVVLLPIDGSDLGHRTAVLKDRLTAVEGVASGSILTYAPGQSQGEQSNAYPFRTAGMGTEADPLLWDIMPGDHDFLATLDIKLAAGRFFSRDTPSDSTRAFVINEAAARAMGWDDPVGQPLDWYMPGPNGFDLQHAGTVIGVVQDFHAYSLHESIRPTVLLLPVFGWLEQSVALRLDPATVPTTLAALEAAWDEYLPDTPFEYTFLDDAYARLYTAETRTGQMFGWMTLLALFVACLGLVGLSSYLTHRLTKEIGIRKVLGANTFDILARLMRSFLGLVLVGIALALPLAWLAMDRWLEQFAYRTNVSPLLLLGVAVATLLLAAAVVSYHSLRAARTNPAHSLRTE